MIAIGFLGADVDARFNKLGHQMMCMCGCNQVLLECNHVGCAYSERMRNELTAGLERGDNDSLVLQSFVQKYGNTVLAAPTTADLTRGVDHAIRGICAASVLTVWLVRLWKARPVAQPVATPNLAAENWTHCVRRRGRRQNFDAFHYVDCRSDGTARRLSILFGCALFAAALFVYVFYEPGNVEAGEGKTRYGYLQERKDATYENLRDLNFEYKAGKLSEQDYAMQRAALEDEAAAILAEMETSSRLEPW